MQLISVEMKVLNVTSDAFGDRKFIPPKYTCDGADVNPPLVIQAIPKEAKSLVLIVEDLDAPSGIWTHWVVWNIPPSEKIPEGSTPGIEGINDFGNLHYGGPCPPLGTHHYFFKIYALDALLDLKPGINRREVEKGMSDHIIAFGELIGLYKRAM